MITGDDLFAAVCPRWHASTHPGMQVVTLSASASACHHPTTQLTITTTAAPGPSFGSLQLIGVESFCVLYKTEISKIWALAAAEQQHNLFMLI